MNSQKAAWKYYMIYESTSRLLVAHTLRIYCVLWLESRLRPCDSGACGILTNRTELQSPVMKLEFMYVYLVTAVLVSVNTKIETYNLYS
jgi:hypothetical protein